jgi:uncharacterized Zn ribbon protein
MPNRDDPSQHRRFRVQFECGECGHEWTEVYEWPQQDRMPVEDCPECGLDGTDGVIYHGGERID